MPRHTINTIKGLKTMACTLVVQATVAYIIIRCKLFSFEDDKKVYFFP